MTKLIATIQNVWDLPALINAGADEVVCALEGCSSSALAVMNLEEIGRLIKEASSYQVRVSLLVNRLFHEDELENLRRVAVIVSSMEIEHIYFADPAVYDIFEECRTILVYDPGTLVSSSMDGLWWLHRGIDAVVVSPLLTLAETEEIEYRVEYAIVQVYGRSVMSRSYRKLLSSYAEFYKKKVNVNENRSLTLIETKREDRMPVFEDETGTLIYTDYILDSFHEIEKIIAQEPKGIFCNGVFAQRSAYLEAVHAYRRILDGENAEEVGKEYREKFKDEPLSSGYYELKTVR